MKNDKWLMNHWPVASDWSECLESALDAESFAALSEFLENETQTETVYPAAENIFAAFKLTSFADTKVVILGQDPYHGPGQAHGLSFSVVGQTKFPPSLRNIFKELESDLGVPPPPGGDLSDWAKQGVLLLNTVLTVRRGEANSHKKRGWEDFTDAVISCFNDHPEKVVFVLWGKPAEKKAKLIDDRHPKIISPHPSPLSAHRGFFGSRPFSSVNEALRNAGRSEIRWA